MLQPYIERMEGGLDSVMGLPKQCVVNGIVAVAGKP